MGSNWTLSKGVGALSERVTSNPEAEATLQRQRGLLLPNVATTNRLASVLSKSLARRTSEDLFPRTQFRASVRIADNPPRITASDAL